MSATSPPPILSSPSSRPGVPPGRRLFSRLDTAQPDFEARLAALLAWEASQDAAIEQAVAEIVRDVRLRGDAAVLEFPLKLPEGEPPDRTDQGDSHPRHDDHGEEWHLPIGERPELQKHGQFNER